jgi:hypothetical protein
MEENSLEIHSFSVDISWQLLIAIHLKTKKKRMLLLVNNMKKMMQELNCDETQMMAMMNKKKWNRESVLFPTFFCHDYGMGCCCCHSF